MKLYRLFILLISIQITLFASINLTQEEKNFIQSHPQITIGIGLWEPYAIQKNDGSVTGYDAEVLHLINELSGANFQLITGDWAMMRKKARAKEIDGLSNTIVTEERKNYFNASNSYVTVQKLIFTTRMNPSNIHTVEDLIGKKIGIHKSNILENRIAKRFTKSTIIKFNTLDEGISSIVTGKIDAIIGDNILLYRAIKIDLPYLKANVHLKNTNTPLVFSIRKDWPEAISIINKALDDIGKQKLLILKNKWFLENNDYSDKVQLTEEEILYLKKKKRITMCIDPDWMPFESFNDKGKHIGLSADFFKIFRKELPIPIKIIKTETWTQSLQLAKSRECDILALAMQTPERKKYLNFTSPYLKVPLVLATKLDKPFIANFDELKSKKVGIPKNYAFMEILKTRYPNLELIEVDNIRDGLKKVLNGKLYGYVGTLASVGYLFQREYNGEFKIAGKFDSDWELSVGVRGDDLNLLEIFEKLVLKVDETQQRDILNSWISIKYEKGIDYSLVLKVFLAAVIIILTFLYANRKLSRAKEKLEEANKEIKIYLKMIDENVLISTSDIEGKITDISEALCKLTGRTKKEFIGRKHNIFNHRDMDVSRYDDILKTIKKGEVWKGEFKNLKKDGSFFWAETIITPMYGSNTILIGYSTIHSDITDKKRIEKLSVTDKLTAIFNRSKLDDAIEYELNRAHRYKSTFGVILLDIDHFKKVNDTYGHLVGDEVLIEIAKILKINIRKLDTLGRWGGEEFLIICPQADAKGIIKLAENLRKKIEEFNFKNCEHQSASFGITLSKEDDTKDSVILRADRALYKIKESGRNSVLLIE